MRMSRLNRRRRTAATTVEFAFVVPIIFTVFLGAVETTNLNFLRNMSNDVAFHVAREAIVPGADISALEAEAVNSLANAGISDPVFATVITPDNQLLVEVTIPVYQNSWGILPLAVGSSVVSTCELSLQLNPN